MGKEATQFKKGEATGRPKGVQNKATVEIKAAIRKVFEDNISGLQEELGKMSAATKWKVIESLLKFAYPTFAQHKLEGDLNHAITVKVEYGVNQVQDLNGNEPNLLEDTTSAPFTDIQFPEVTETVTQVKHNDEN